MMEIDRKVATFPVPGVKVTYWENVLHYAFCPTATECFERVKQALTALVDHPHLWTDMGDGQTMFEHDGGTVEPYDAEYR